MSVPKEETDQAVIVRVKNFLIQSKTLSPTVVSTFKMVHVTIEAITFDKPTNLLAPAREIYKSQPNIPFRT